MVPVDGDFDILYQEVPFTYSDSVQVRSSRGEYSSTPPTGSERPNYFDTKGSLVQNGDLIDNHVHHCPGTGLRVQTASWIYIIGNELYNNSRRSSISPHGLVLDRTIRDASVPNDVQMCVGRNLVYSNYIEIYIPERVLNELSLPNLMKNKVFLRVETINSTALVPAVFIPLISLPT